MNTNTPTQKKWDVLSPDGFSISFDEQWDTKEEAAEALKQWAKRFERQGYYSSCNGRIALSELADYCKFIEVDPLEEDEL